MDNYRKPGIRAYELTPDQQTAVCHTRYYFIVHSFIFIVAGRMFNNDAVWGGGVTIDEIMNTVCLLNGLLINSMRIINTFRVHMCISEIKKLNIHPDKLSEWFVQQHRGS